MRICTLNTTGALIEMQSDATEGTLIANAVACGYIASDVTESEISPDEYDARFPPMKVVRPVSPRQIRLALNQAGLRSAVEAYISAAPQDVKDTWEFSTVIERNSPLIAAGAAKLNLTEAQIDDLFTLAATL